MLAPQLADPSLPSLETAPLDFLSAEDGGMHIAQGCVNYMRPDGDSLMGRKLVTPELLLAEELFRMNPEKYREQVQAGYMDDVEQLEPTVVNINAQVAAQAVGEFLGRIHTPYFSRPPEKASRVVLDFRMRSIRMYAEGDSCEMKAEYVGRGDTSPLIGIPGLIGPELPPAKWPAA